MLVVRRSTRLWQLLVAPYWRSARKWKIRGATLLLALLTVAQVGLSVWGNYWNRALFDELEARSVRGVILQAAVFALIFVISMAVTAAHLLVKRWLQLDWRGWLTYELIGRWLEQGRHYRLLFSDGEHDNPDQRIAEDIRIATDGALGLAHTLFFSLLSLGTFVQILWSVSGSMAVPGTSVQIPGYMVPLAFLYAGIGTVLGWLLGRPLERSTNALQTAEANFRFGLSRARERSEAIALLHGEEIERASAAKRFRQVVRDFNWQSHAFLGIVSFWSGYGGLLPVFPILIAAPQYIAGAMTLGTLMQAAQAFQRLTSALSWPVDNAAGIAICRASAERVLSLLEDIGRLDAESLARGGGHIMVVASAEPRLGIDDLTIVEPSGQVMSEHISIEIRAGERVLVTGDSAVTSRFFKVIAGLWPWGRGRVQLPDGETLFMPQRPFLPEGTLRNALCYPRTNAAFSDAAIRAALDRADIGWMAERLDEQNSWEQALPLRAQQRLAFSRALLLAPTWLYMEQATDAFDADAERRMLEMLHRELPRTTLVTISFHAGLESLHDRKIVLRRVRETKRLEPERSVEQLGAQ
jgi:putative ATP-binding cassette transporter